MRALMPTRVIPVAIVLLTLINISHVRPAAAQERPRPAAELALGALMFADDGVVNEGFAGGAARFYLSPRVALGPEVAFINAEHHSHQMLTGNVTFDLIAPANGQPRPITPFLVVGGGLFRTREAFFSGPFASSDPAFTAGGGVRASAGKYVFAGAEARIGWELHIRVNGLVGVRFGE